MSLLWRLLLALFAIGVLAIVVLFFLWRSGRVPAVRTLAPSGKAIVAFSGLFPSGGRDVLVAPRSVTVQGDRAYVTEPDKSRITVFTTGGAYVRAVPIVASGRTYPVDCAVIGDRLYVVDAAGRRVLQVPDIGGSARAVATELVQPTAVQAFGADLLIWDAVRGLVRFSPARGTVSRVSRASDLNGAYAGGLSVADGHVFVSDTGGSRVLKVGLAQGDVAAFGNRISLPRGVAVDDRGRVWVADVFGGTVQVFDDSGTALGDIEREEISGVGAPDLDTPQGVAYSSAIDRLFVVDEARGLVLVYAVAD